METEDIVPRYGKDVNDELKFRLGMPISLKNKYDRQKER